MEARFHPLADAEYWAEVHYYETFGSELAERFEVAIGKTVSQIEKNPYLCHNRGDGVF